ncbi:MAG: stress-induced protein [Candidatus Sungbacteria bacterium]|nr:stress-induced protein [Candidatus Sungbacteria bacterium]
MSEIKKRGFGSMTPEKRREIARKGGQTAHLKGTAHRYNREEARDAGRRGGQAVSVNRQYMAEIGRKGGKNSGERRRQKIAEDVVEVPS